LDRTTHILASGNESGRPSFNELQNGSANAPLIYYALDVMILAGRDVMNEPLTARRELLAARVLASLGEPIRESPVLDARLLDPISSVKAHGLEGLVAKRRDSRYEPGQRSAAWQKMRVNQSQAFVIAGYTEGARNFEAVVFGYYEGGRLMYAGRTRSGFTPASRDQLFKRFQALARGRMSVRQPSGAKRRPMGRGTDSGEDEGMPVAQADAGRAVRVRRMDTGRPLEAFTLYGPPGGQIAAGCDPWTGRTKDEM
jgi:ATP-dependent DNA ligase